MATGKTARVRAFSEGITVGGRGSLRSSSPGTRLISSRFAEISMKDWNQKAKKVSEKMGISVNTLNGLILGIAALASGIGKKGFYKGKLSEKILHDMGYTRKDLRDTQNIPGKLPPWLLTPLITSRDPDYDIVKMVKKQGISVNEAWKILQSKSRKSLERKAESNVNIPLGDNYHPAVGWY